MPEDNGSCYPKDTDTNAFNYVEFIKICDMQ